MWWYRIGAVILTAGVGSFTWFYEHPLAADFPFHVAIAHAFAQLISGAAPDTYPYVFSIKVSAYAPAQILLSLFVHVFGPLLGSKVALTAYAIAFPLSVAWLVARLSPESTWERLAGFPLTLNYIFHWGFWAYLPASVAAIISMAMIVRAADGRHSGLAVNAILRLLVFAFHPVACVAVGIFDIWVCLVSDKQGRMVGSISRWRWSQFMAVWSLAIGFAIAQLLLTDAGTRMIAWENTFRQLIQLVRPVYLTRHWWEAALPVLIWMIASFITIVLMVKGRKLDTYVLAGCTIIALGLVFPRASFISSNEQGVRVVLLGWVVMVAAWSLYSTHSKLLRHLILAWIVLGSTHSLIASHYLWSRHDASHSCVLRVLRDTGGGAFVTTENRNAGSTSVHKPVFNMGTWVSSWAWASGYIADAHNFPADSKTWGPVRQVGLDAQSHEATKELVRDTIRIVYHPYEIPSDLKDSVNGQLLYQDSIYTMYRIE